MSKRTIAVLLISVTVGMAATLVLRGKGVLGQGAPPKAPPRLAPSAPTPAAIRERDCNAVRAELDAIRHSEGVRDFGVPSLDYDCDKGTIVVRVFVPDSWFDSTDIATVKETLRSYGNLSSRALFENRRLARLMAAKATRCSVDFFTLRNGGETTIATYDFERDEVALRAEPAP